MEIRNERDATKEYAKDLKFAVMKYGDKMSSLGFSAKEMIGEKFVGNMGEGNPARESNNFE